MEIEFEIGVLSLRSHKGDAARLEVRYMTFRISGADHSVAKPVISGYGFGRP
jgi:hypothetical protein